ncbi:hypothetical protein ACLKA6_001052 [Drosophila palustris]
MRHEARKVLAYRDAGHNKPFESLALFAIELLSLPWSKAEVERVFSQMNIVKTKLRNKMHLKTLNAILSIRYGLRRNASRLWTVDGGLRLKPRTKSQGPGSVESTSHSLIAMCRQSLAARVLRRGMDMKKDGHEEG